ncbi:MAG: IS4/IS5 family transposase, partial [Deltaproteobacteria bacterium]|nr:IS4/IS5 family transposase [Deltaproteobacteria bacterium]
EFIKSGKREDIITLKPDADAIRKCNTLGLSSEPIRLRLIRIDLPKRQHVVLITSLLDTNLYPYEIFEELYRMRWPVEEDYKLMKCRIEIENFSGKSVESVYQDFHAKVFTMNLAAALAHPAQQAVDEDNDRKYKYQVNMTHIMSIVKDTVVLLFTRSNISVLLRRLLDLFSKTIEPVRPDRKYPRNIKVNRKRFHLAYKPTR